MPLFSSLQRHRHVILAALVGALIAAPAAAQFATTEISGTGSASPLLVTKSGWSWESIAAVTYSIYRSDRPDAGFACILDGHPNATWVGDQTAIPASGLSYYLVTGHDGVTDNSPGAWSNSTPRTLATLCPRPCCMGDGTCIETDAPACVTAGGLSQAPGTTCLTTVCTGPCASGTPVSGMVPLQRVSIGPNFAAPIFLTAPTADPRLFILERAGRIRIQHPDGTRTLFLDFSADVPSTASERGALGLAFHPDYATNGRFFVFYTGAVTVRCGNGSCSTVSEFTVTADPDVADPLSERILFQTGHAQGNHNGGWVGFGPDRMLYFSIGDGGEQGDPNGRAQNLSQYQGKIMRINVDGRDAGLEYAVPPDNPFLSVVGAQREIWMYGMRNPWRCSFDRLTGDLYVADVGQNCWEEVSVVTAASGGGSGVNLGWNTIEGTHCFNAGNFNDCTFTGCAPLGQAADWDYQHVNGYCSITGGYVYRGCRMPDWQGWYFFSDYCGEWMDAFSYAGGAVATSRRIFPDGTLTSPVAYGEDSNGEIYIVHQGGQIFRLEP